MNDNVIARVSALATEAHADAITNAPVFRFDHEKMVPDVVAEGAYDDNNAEETNANNEHNNENANENERNNEREEEHDELNVVNENGETNAMITDDEDSIDNDKVNNNEDKNKEKINFNDVFEYNISEEENNNQRSKSNEMENQRSESNDPRSANEGDTAYEEQRSKDSAYQPSVHGDDDINNEDNSNINSNSVETTSQNVNTQLEPYNLRRNVRKTKDLTFNEHKYTFLMCYKNRIRSISKKENQYVRRICNTMFSMSRGEPYNDGMLQKDIVHHCMNQMSSRRGIQLFVEKALDAMVNEYTQLDKLSGKNSSK